MSWFSLFEDKRSSRESAIETFKKLAQKSTNDMLTECKEHKRLRLSYSFSSTRGRTIICAHAMNGAYVGGWPQPIEGYDYPTGTLPKVK